MNDKDGRLPPQNQEAEERVLGSIPLNPGCFPGVRRILLPEDFYRRDHGLIFAAMRSVADEHGGDVDFLAVVEELRRTGNLDKVGWPEVFPVLHEGVGSARRADTWARMVADAAQRRRAIESLTAGLERLWDSADSETSAILADIRSLVDENFDLIRREGAAAQPLRALYEALPPAPPAIVDPLIFPGNCGFIGADAGAGKTTTADALALAVCSGLNAWGYFHVSSPRNVLWIQLEDPLRRHGDRLMRIWRGMGRTAIPDNIFRWDRSAFFMDNPRDMADLYAFVREKDIGLVLADPFVYMHGLDENSNSEMSRLLRPVKTEFQGFDCALMIVHHNKHVDPKYRGAEIG